MNAETAPAKSGTLKRRRQDPVSCQCCRKKKLKCDRRLPCSSCLSRRLQCSYGICEEVTASATFVNGPSTRARTPSGTLAPFMTGGIAAGSVDRNAVHKPVAMAKRLEAIITRGRIHSVDGMRPLSKVYTHQTGSATADNSLPRTLIGIVCRDTMPSQILPTEIDLLTYLPEEAETLSLFRYYCDYLDYQYRLIIPQDAAHTIAAIYQLRSRRKKVDIGQLALVFSILAAAAFFQLLSSDSARLADDCAREITYLVGAALIQSNHVAFPNVEGLQAAMIIARHLPSLFLSEAMASLFIHAALVTQGKALGLHILDSPLSTGTRRECGLTRAAVELRRRLWWDLASCDWMLAFFSGPQEGTYFTQTRHMNVKKPRNIENENIENGTELPLSTPTCLSYSLCRIKMAEVCRDIADEIAQDAFQSEEVSYQNILNLDRKLRDAYAEIPDYFRLDPTSRRTFATLCRAQPQLAWQRALLHQGYLSRLCRLHRQYFVCGARDPKFSYSHIVSLQSARKILEVKRIMDEEEPRFMPNSSLLWVVTHHVFIAAVILLIDGCFNWDDILAEKRKEEVLEACKMLSHAQQSSTIVCDGITAMMEIMHKHWKYDKSASDGEPADASLRNGNASVGGPDISMTGMEVFKAQHSLNNNHGPGPTNEGVAAVHLEDIWSGLLGESAQTWMEPCDWMGMLDELTNAV